MSVTRYEATIHVKTTSAMHSGGVDETVNRAPDPETKQKRTATAQRFARDGHGRPVLPGRSIKGAIRAACERASGDRFAHLWGGEERASVLTVHPIVLCGSDGKELVASSPTGDDYEGLRHRPGIAIDRYWGAVGDGALFMHEVLPANARLQLRLSAHVDARAGIEQQQVEDLLNLIVKLLGDGRIRFGKRASIGWGQITLDDEVPQAVIIKRTQIDSPEGLMSWLQGGKQIPNVGASALSESLQADLEAGQAIAPDVVTFEVTWSSPTGVLVADVERYEVEVNEQNAAKEYGTQDANDKKPVPTRPYQDDLSTDGRMVIPGSSIRGALRNRATRIARTVLFAEGHLTEDDRQAWADMGIHEQLAGDVPLIHDLFGTTERRGAVRVHDVTSRGKGRKLTVTHNAGDRWTGGVKDRALYAEEYYVDTRWDKIVVEVDPTFLFDAPQEREAVKNPLLSAEYIRGRRRASLALLGLVMAELAAGTLPLGSRITRGMGAVEVSEMTVSGPAELLGETPWELDAKSGSVAAGLLQHLRNMYGKGAIDWTKYLLEPEMEADGQSPVTQPVSEAATSGKERA